MTPDEREAALEAICPEHPSWHRRNCLSVLIPLANSVAEHDHLNAVLRLGSETMASFHLKSRHDQIRIMRELSGISYSEEEFLAAARSPFLQSRVLYGGALKVAMGGGAPTQDTLHLLTLLAEEITW